MAPPCILLSEVLTRYLTAIRDSAYLVAMPNTPVSQHHSTAPGPPMKIAVPTPMMLLVPMVEARAVVRAWNWLTSPGESGSLVKDNFDARADFALNDAGPCRQEQVGSEQQDNHGGRPHTRPSNQFTKLVKLLRNSPLL